MTLTAMTMARSFASCSEATLRQLVLGTRRSSGSLSVPAQAAWILRIRCLSGTDGDRLDT